MEVVVHKIGSNNQFQRAGEHALFYSPAMKLIERPSSFLAHCAKRSPSATTNRNSAYALSYWFNFCQAADIDWEHAAVDDLFDYKAALETTVSHQTGTYRSEGTVSQYVGAVVEFYDFAFGRSWYHGDIRKTETPRRAVNPDSDRLAHIRHGGPSRKKLSPIGRKRNQSGTMIKPLSVSSLRQLLAAIGPDAGDAPEGTSVRNRLIADWGWAVGLRISEMLTLDAAQFYCFVVEEENPWVHFSVQVLGKGNKFRRVSVPSWLIGHTQAYIRGERQCCVDLGETRDTEEKLFVSSANSRSPGLSITPRRVEAIFEEAYLRANLVADIRRIDPLTNLTSRRQIPCHCVHDLRHTYSVLTYHAEVALGNCEPWKKIQAQLGHASLKTTTDIYLEYVHAHNDFRHASVRDLIGLAR